MAIEIHHSFESFSTAGGTAQFINPPGRPAGVDPKAAICFWTGVLSDEGTDDHIVGGVGIIDENLNQRCIGFSYVNGIGIQLAHNATAGDGAIIQLERPGGAANITADGFGKILGLVSNQYFLDWSFRDQPTFDEFRMLWTCFYDTSGGDLRSYVSSGLFEEGTPFQLQTPGGWKPDAYIFPSPIDNAKSFPPGPANGGVNVSDPDMELSIGFAAHDAQQQCCVSTYADYIVPGANNLLRAFVDNDKILRDGSGSSQEAYAITSWNSDGVTIENVVPGGDNFASWLVLGFNGQKQVAAGILDTPQTPVTTITVNIPFEADSGFICPSLVEVENAIQQDSRATLGFGMHMFGQDLASGPIFRQCSACANAEPKSSGLSNTSSTASETRCVLNLNNRDTGFQAQVLENSQGFDFNFTLVSGFTSKWPYLVFGDPGVAEKELSGAAIATSQARGNLIKKLSGRSIGQANARGRFAITRNLAGTSQATSLARGLAFSTAFASGTSVATSSARGLLVRTAFLAGVSQAGALARGLITADSALSGNARGVATARGRLLRLARLRGTTIGTSLARGDVESISILEARSIGTSLARGRLVRIVPLTGRSRGVGLARGFLLRTAFLEGVSVAGGLARGLFFKENEQMLAGSALATSLARAAVVRTAFPSGTALGVSSARGLITQDHLRAGTAIGTSQARGNLQVITNLSGSVQAAATARGSLVATRKLSGRSVGGALARGLLLADRILVGRSVATAQARGVLFRATDEGEERESWNVFMRRLKKPGRSLVAAPKMSWDFYQLQATDGPNTVMQILNLDRGEQLMSLTVAWEQLATGIQADMLIGVDGGAADGLSVERPSVTVAGAFTLYGPWNEDALMRFDTDRLIELSFEGDFAFITDAQVWVQAWTVKPMVKGL